MTAVAAKPLGPSRGRGRGRGAAGFMVAFAEWGAGSQGATRVGSRRLDRSDGSGSREFVGRSLRSTAATAQRMKFVSRDIRHAPVLV